MKRPGDSLSNFNLQKLVYYAQGFHFALLGRPLFDVPILAWEHGPVVPSLYRKLKQHGSDRIATPEEGIDVFYSKELRGLLGEVFQVYGKCSASKFRNMTHVDPPWVEAHCISPSTVISLDSMKIYFSPN